MAMGRSRVLGRPKSHPGRRQITTVPYALTMRSGIGGFHFHPGRSGGGRKPDVPPRAHTTLQNPISRRLSWTLFVGPGVHAGPPPVMGVSYSRRPIAAPSFYGITTAVTAIRRATQNAIIRFQTTAESRVECVLSCRRKWWRAGPVHPHCRATRAPTSSNQQMPSHAFSPRAQAAAPASGLFSPGRPDCVAHADGVGRPAAAPTSVPAGPKSGQVHVGSRFWYLPISHALQRRSTSSAADILHDPSNGMTIRKLGLDIVGMRRKSPSVEGRRLSRRSPIAHGI